MRAIIALLMIVSLMVLVGCSKDDAMVQDTQPQPVVQEPTPEPAQTAPVQTSEPTSKPPTTTVDSSDSNVEEVENTATNDVYLESATSDSPKRDEAQAAGCVDSDNGIDYFVQGTLQDYKGSTKMDQCSTSMVYTNRLYEYYCDENQQYIRVMYDCPNGCMNGACVK